MKKIEFTDKNADKIYQGYIIQVKNIIKTLSPYDQEDILMEINSHIYESLQQETGVTETEALTITLKRLGEPKDILTPLVAERKLSQATKTFNPKHVLKALLLNSSNGFIYVIFSISYLFLFCFASLIILKLIFPESVGLFLGEGEFHFGWIANIEEKNLNEVLGYWFIPIVLLTIGVLYFFITLLLKLKYKLKPKSGIYKL